MRRTKRRWVGIDGEGVGRAPHRYVLLACSDEDYIERKSGLRTNECLDFLLTLGTRDARVCGYYLSYDWTMILKDVPDVDLYRLLRPELRARPRESGGGFDRVSYGEYELHYLAGAMWIRGERNRRVTVWDLGKFYQGPFVDALKDWDLSKDVRDRIAEMKKRRDVFTWAERDQIRRYCLQECKALAELAGCLEQAHVDAGIKMRAWHGPGSTAGALLNQYGIKEKLGPPLPPEVRKAAAIAYCGGRAEIGCNGRIEAPVFELDIASAYPAHATRLPCLVHGRWGKTRDAKHLATADIAIVHGEIQRVTSDWGPLPIRRENGSIVYPRGGASGYWYKDEWLQANQLCRKGLRFDHALVYYTQCSCRPPFAFLHDLYLERMRVGKKTGAGRILKLGPNSVYGKLAQRVGPAQYASSIWAGLITSGTRTQLLEHMCRHKRLDSVVMLATDGLFTTEDIPIDYTPQLGGWERDVHPHGMTLVRPGIYWTPDGKLRARGIGRDNTQAALKIFEYALTHKLDRTKLPWRTVFGGARVTVYRTQGGIRRSALYGQWHPIPTRVSLAPGPKRGWDWRPPLLSGEKSAPYAVRKGNVFQKQEELQALTL